MCLFGGKPPAVKQPDPIKLPDPAPPPEKTPEPPSPSSLNDSSTRKSAQRASAGTSSLRIPLNVPGAGKSGLNI